jgi:hypothetical protein
MQAGSTYNWPDCARYALESKWSVSNSVVVPSQAAGVKIGESMFTYPRS